jgi:hypothetical protein
MRRVAGSLVAVLCLGVLLASLVPPTRAADDGGSAAAAAPVYRQWSSVDGKQQWTGEFWRISKGTLEVRPQNAQEPVAIPLAQLSTEDLQFLLADEEHVLQPSFALARAGYVLTADHKLLVRDQGFVKIEGTVASVINADLAIVKGAARSYAVTMPGAALVKNAEFSAYGQLAGKDTFTAPDGTEVRLYTAYTGFERFKPFKELLLADPRAMLAVLTGESPAYRTWANAQARVAQIQERQEANQAVRDAKAEAKTAAQHDAQVAQQEKKLKRQLADAESRLKNLEAEKQKAENQLKHAELFTRQYNDAKKHVDEVQKQIHAQEKVIAELQQQLADVQSPPGN